MPTIACLDIRNLCQCPTLLDVVTKKEVPVSALPSYQEAKVADHLKHVALRWSGDNTGIGLISSFVIVMQECGCWYGLEEVGIVQGSWSVG